MIRQLIFAFTSSLITVLIITPLVIRIALTTGVTDQPDYRKVHIKPMPRLGGLAIFIGVTVGYFVSGLFNKEITAITVGGIAIFLLGLLDDKYGLSPKIKLIVQFIVSLLVIASGLTIEVLNIPFLGVYELGLFSYPLTVFWVIGITNAINLIDGLDGLAVGISGIVVSTIAILAGINGNHLILTICIIFIGSVIGFLPYNFHPAKIFMGDSGALLLGYTISIISLIGLYKSVTLFSFIVPILILGVPVFDVTFAIIRRIANKKPISAPDKGHLHHRLLLLGLSHRQTVLVLYSMSVAFSIIAYAFSSTTLWGSILILCGVLVFLEICAEWIGLVGKEYKPFLTFYRKVMGKS